MLLCYFQALEGLGESQEVRSQDLNPSKSDIFNLDNMYNSKNEIPESGETGENFFDVSRLSLHDKGWISPPESITSCSSDSGVTSSETSLADTSNGPDIMDPIHHSVDGREGREHSLLSPSVGIPLPEMSPSEQSRSQNIQVSGLG